MPLIDVTLAAHVPAGTRTVLAEGLPHLVSTAVACDEEPYDGDLQPGDVLIRFHRPEPGDRFDLDVLVEIHSKWTEQRARDRQRRSDLVLDGLRADLLAGTPYAVGVYLSLPVAAWSQTD